MVFIPKKRVARYSCHLFPKATEKLIEQFNRKTKKNAVRKIQLRSRMPSIPCIKTRLEHTAWKRAKKWLQFLNCNCRSWEQNASVINNDKIRFQSTDRTGLQSRSTDKNNNKAKHNSSSVGRSLGRCSRKKASSICFECVSVLLFSLYSSSSRCVCLAICVCVFVVVVFFACKIVCFRCWLHTSHETNVETIVAIKRRHWAVCSTTKTQLNALFLVLVPCGYFTVRTQTPRERGREMERFCMWLSMSPVHGSHSALFILLL